MSSLKFKHVRHISDITSVVEGKKEIRFNKQPNGITIGCYMFMDSKTFDSPEAIECRGIAFDDNGEVVSRPLHKFFNVGEKDWLSPDRMLEREDIAAVFEKLDGSMIATACVNDGLAWRSKKSFTSDVVRLTERFVANPENANLRDFALQVIDMEMTAIFELTHPDARIVVAQPRPALRLLHVRRNDTGEYVTLDDGHFIHKLIARYRVPTVRRFTGMSVRAALDSLEAMTDCEGYVIQFANGDMAKLKCPWYSRLHRSITFLRERDIAALALAEELDDVKGQLNEAGIDLAAVNAVEARLKGLLLGIEAEVDAIYQAGRGLERKDFAVANKANPLFGLAMERYLGRESSVSEWYARNRLKEDFTLRVLADGALAEAIEA